LKLCGDSAALCAMVFHLKGALYLARGENELAVKSFQAAINANSNFLRPYYALARIYLDARQEEKAISQYKALLEVNPNQARPHMLLGVIYDTQKRFDLSEKHYRAALEVDPDFAAAANNLAYILADHDKKLTEALNLARMAIEKLSDNPYVMDTLGWVYYKKGLYDSAISEFSDSLAKIPENAAVIYHLGMAYYKKGDLNKARVELEKALRLDDSFSGAHDARKVLAAL
jgi:tetratricopeptide (TPR) repeat protein